MTPAAAQPVPETTGKTPDLRAQTAPMDLPRLVMRRALAVAVGCLLLALVLGLLRVRLDTEREMAGSLALARAARQLALLQGADPRRAVEELRTLEGLRHLRLEVLDADRLTVLALPPPQDAAPSGSGADLVRRLGVTAAAQTVSWPVQQPEERTWTVVLSASPDSEVQEALGDLGGLFLLLAGCSVTMLAVMQWNVRRSFRPLHGLLGAIARIEQQDPDAVRRLPAMPIRELEAIAQALRRLVDERERNESARRVLGHRLLSVQDDERRRLARDLHDEFGQRLTGLRVDAAWLQRRLEDAPELRSVAAGMAQQIGLIQDDVRQLLQRLRPHASEGDDGSPATVGRLRLLLQDLVSGWQAAANSHGIRFELQVEAADDDLPLPCELVSCIYRISQEALTNVARHAGAQHARLALRVEGDTLHWSVGDDGRGLAGAQAAWQRGNGLVGMQDRVWAMGGDFDWHSESGLSLRARLPLAAIGIEAQP